MSESIGAVRVGLIGMLFSISCNLLAESPDLPVHNPVPGGIAVLPIGPDDMPSPAVHFGKRPVPVVNGNGTWNALVGLPQDIVPGRYMVSVNRSDDQSELRHFTVTPLPASYRQRMIMLPELIRHFDLAVQIPDPAPIAGTPEISAGLPAEFVFRHAAEARIIVPYGRVVQESGGTALINHPGISYFTGRDSFVKAPGSGVVMRVIESDDRGNSLVLVHGDGFQSVLTHMGRILVVPGDIVEIGHRLGTVARIPQSELGRVDWFLLLNGTSIDPSPLLAPAPTSS